MASKIQIVFYKYTNLIKHEVTTTAKQVIKNASGECRQKTKKWGCERKVLSLLNFKVIPFTAPTFIPNFILTHFSARSAIS